MPAKANIWRVAEEEETITETGTKATKAEIGAKEGVNAQINPSKNVGLFTKGGPGGPGRPSKAKELAMLDAINSAFTPEQVTAHLKTAMDIAVSTNSARGIVAVLEFMSDRLVGRPVQRTQEVRQSIADILNDDGDSG